MTVFLIIGVVGLALVLASLVLGEVFEGLFDFDADAGGVLSTPVIGSFLAAFGFGSALILYGTDVGAGVAALGGVVSGGVLGGLALLITRNLMQMPTDVTLRSGELVGSTAIVVTRIPLGGTGEVSLSFRGQLMKLGARASAALGEGTVVTITAVTSPSSVVVASTDADAPR